MSASPAFQQSELTPWDISTRKSLHRAGEFYILHCRSPAHGFGFVGCRKYSVLLVIIRDSNHFSFRNWVEVSTFLLTAVSWKSQESLSQWCRRALPKLPIPLQWAATNSKVLKHSLSTHSKRERADKIQLLLLSFSVLLRSHYISQALRILQLILPKKSEKPPWFWEQRAENHVQFILAAGISARNLKSSWVLAQV